MRIFRNKLLIILYVCLLAFCSVWVFFKIQERDIVNQLKQEQGKNIWICGGANIIQQLMQADLIDEYYISVIPTILGSGIRLFGKIPKEIKLELVHTQTYNGITDLVYKRR